MGILNSFFYLLATLTGGSLLIGCAGVTEKSPQQTPQVAQLSVIPASVDFKNVVVGQKITQTIQISNAGKATLNVTAISLTGSGFSLGSVTAPLQLAPGANKNFTISFAPAAAATDKGAIMIASDDPTSPFNVALQGTGEKALASWQISPSSITFSSLTLLSTQNQNASIQNTGNVPVTVSSANLSSSAFSISGLTSGLILAPNQQVNFQITFRPTVVGTATGALTVTSAPAFPTLKMALTGSGSSSPTTPTTQHTVTLTWDHSTSSVSGYRVYRGKSAGGPYTQLNSSLIPVTNYSDETVVSGTEYFYVTTAVDPSGDESSFSNETSANVPN